MIFRNILLFIIVFFSSSVFSAETIPDLEMASANLSLPNSNNSTVESKSIYSARIKVTELLPATEATFAAQAEPESAAVDIDTVPEVAGADLPASKLPNSDVEVEPESFFSAVMKKSETEPTPEITPGEVSSSVPQSDDAVVPDAIENSSSPLRKIKASLALQKIELFRTSVKETTKEKGIFSRIFSSDSNPIDVALLDEMRKFTEKYASLPQTDEVFYLMALVHERMSNYQAAALDWNMLKVMYPYSSLVVQTNKRLKELAGDQLSKFTPMLDKISLRTGFQDGDMDQRTGAFLAFLGTFREESFAPAIAAECVSFLVRNETFSDEDVIENAIAHQAMLIDNDIALYRFAKLLALYPASNFRADSLLSMASIQREKLKNYNEAEQTFVELIDKHPDSNETKLGYESLAMMYNVEMRDYPNAIKTYNSIIARYKNDPVVLRGLFVLEKIYETKTHQLDKAIDTYLKLSEVFETGKEGMKALLAAERLAVNSVRNWEVAIGINKRIMLRAPNTEDAVKALYANANITDKKLGDKNKAKVMYQDFIKTYPKHSLSKDAQKRIAALTKN
ncbi:MAG: tetratricopeptide repeat protein [Gallionellaceae bacterium]